VVERSTRVYWVISAALAALLAVAVPASAQDIAPPAPPAASADPFLATIATMKRAVTPIACMETAQGGVRRPSRIAGTAFFLTPDGEFMTAAHVIADVLRGSLNTGTEGCASPVVYLPVTEWPSGSNEFDARWYLFDAAKCQQDSGLDLAYCRTRQNPSQDLNRTVATVTFERGLQVDGTAVAFTGFPLNVIQPMTARGHIAMYTSRDELIVDQSAWPGVSGCPVYLVDGRVIGVLIQRGTGDGTGRSIVRTAAQIDAFLARARAAWSKD
jgi:V8-like Glu-specific endopeptidase